MYTPFNSIFMGHTGVYIFSGFWSMTYIVGTRKNRLERVITINVLSKNKKNLKSFQLFIFFNFCWYKNPYILHGLFFKMKKYPLARKLLNSSYIQKSKKFIYTQSNIV